MKTMFLGHKVNPQFLKAAIIQLIFSDYDKNTE